MKDYALPFPASIGQSLHFAMGQTGKPAGRDNRDKHPEYPGQGLTATFSLGLTGNDCGCQRTDMTAKANNCTSATV